MNQSFTKFNYFLSWQTEKRDGTSVSRQESRTSELLRHHPPSPHLESSPGTTRELRRVGDAGSGVTT